jgi:hypothetical protein
MPEYHNPAARLHALLTSFAEHEGESAREAWAAVLEVPVDEVTLHVDEVFRLFREVRDAASATGDDAWDPITGDLVTLSRSLLSSDWPFDTGVGNVMPDRTAMRFLKAFSSHLRDVAPGLRVPDEHELDELRERVRDLIEEVTGTELPPEVKQALVRRLADVLAALEHLKVRGPDGVRAAAEALAVSATLYEADAPDDDERAVFTKMKSLAGAAFRICSKVTKVAGALLLWDQIFDVPLLESGEKPPPAQLPRGPRAEPDSEVPGEEAEPV